MADALIATIQNQNVGTTSGAETVDLLTVDIDANAGSAYADGTVLVVDAVFIASQGTNSRTVRRRALLRIASGQLSVEATDLLGSSIGDVALVAVGTGVGVIASERKFTLQATGVILLDIGWGVVAQTTLYRPAD